MRHLGYFVLCLTTVCGLALGQCSTLTVTGSLNPGETVTIAVTGATADSLTFLVAGLSAGTTTIPLPGTPLVLDVAEPLIIVPFAVTDANGDASLSIPIPADIGPTFPNETFVLQSLTVGFSIAVFPPVFDFCTSNTATLVSGTG